MTVDYSLVPPTRLGSLLADQRGQSGISLDDLAGATGLGLSGAELLRIERGKVALTDDQVNRLLEAYGVSPGDVVPERSELVLDLTQGAVSVGERARTLPENASVDEVLNRYLSLLYLMRDLEPGGRLALRDNDLAVLSTGLQRTISEVEQRLFALMVPEANEAWYRRLQHRITVPAAGLLVGLTAVGSLVIVQFPDGVRPAFVGTSGAANSAAATNTTATNADAVEIAGARVEVSPNASAVNTPGSPADIGAAAEALISYDFRAALPDWTVSYAEPRSGYLGNTNTVTRTITVYISDDATPEAVAGVLAHEVGHALDVMYLNDDVRQRWLTSRGIDEPWWPQSGAGDFHLGAGDFAEAVAVILANSPSDSHHAPFTAAQLELVAAFTPIPAELLPQGN